MMTMPVNDSFDLPFGGLIIVRSLLQELAQQERLLAQSFCGFVVRYQFAHFVPEHARAARFQHHDWQAGIHAISDYFQIAF